MTAIETFRPYPSTAMRRARWIIKPKPDCNPIALVIIRITAISLALASCAIAADTPNGFPLSGLRVERDAIISGGVPRDGIPSIDTPKFIPSDRADFIKDDDLVLSYTLDGTTRAYPLRILVWHEIVNETINAKPILGKLPTVTVFWFAWQAFYPQTNIWKP